MLRIGAVTMRRVFQTKIVVRSFGAHGHGANAAHGHHDAHAHAAHDSHGHDSHAHDSHGDHGHDDHGHDHHGPHVPEGYDKLGKFVLVTAYLWVMYKLKVDNGQLFGYYKPWLHEHEHDHIHYHEADEHANPTPVEEEEDEEVEESEFAGI